MVVKLLSKWLKREKPQYPNDLALPYFQRARQALLRDELKLAIAHLESGIKVAPDHLELYLQRAQIFQYGLNNYSRALRDYRFILRVLEKDPEHYLVCKCREAMRDMMN